LVLGKSRKLMTLGFPSNILILFRSGVAVGGLISRGGIKNGRKESGGWKQSLAQ